MSPDERKLRRLFERLHEDDAPPSFEHVWRAAAGRSSPRRRRLVPAAAFALALVVAAGIAWRWQARPSSPLDPQRLAAELAAWSSPLDFLTEVPGDELFGTQPLPAGEAREILRLLDAAQPENGETL